MAPLPERLIVNENKDKSVFVGDNSAKANKNDAESRWSTSDGVKITQFANRGGTGCIPPFESGLPEHNPKPSTERGKRRHHKRNDDRKKVAEKAWNTGRSSRPSRFQQALGR